MIGAHDYPEEGVLLGERGPFPPFENAQSVGSFRKTTTVTSRQRDSNVFWPCPTAIPRGVCMHPSIRASRVPPRFYGTVAYFLVAANQRLDWLPFRKMQRRVRPRCAAAQCLCCRAEPSCSDKLQHRGLERPVDYGPCQTQSVYSSTGILPWQRRGGYC